MKKTTTPRRRSVARAQATRPRDGTVIFIFGAGKVGRALASAWKKAGKRVVLRPARRGTPKKTIDADVVVLAVRDRDLLRTATAFADIVSPESICVHCAGSRDAESLAPLRGACAGVAQMHPMISFASANAFPALRGGHVHVQGDAIAVRRARALVKSIGMVPRTFPSLDTVGYHAAAGLVANGAAALAAVGATLLERSGVPRAVVPAMLGPLLHSVAENVQRLGFPEALTGPVRRGDVDGLRKHFGVLQERLPSALGLFAASAAAQLPLARAIGDASKEALDEIANFLTEALHGVTKKATFAKHR